MNHTQVESGPRRMLPAALHLAAIVPPVSWLPGGWELKFDPDGDAGQVPT